MKRLLIALGILADDETSRRLDAVDQDLDRLEAEARAAR